MFLKHTKSICRECYREVIGKVCISKSGNVVIEKYCPEHGQEVGLLEVDPNFYLETQANLNPIYAGHFVDVTTRCNLQCAHCYYPCEEVGSDVSIEEIWAECALNNGPYLITGGEPTLRTDLPEVLEQCSTLGPVSLLTNGFGLLDKSFLAACLPSITGEDRINIALSIHEEASYLPEVIENLRELGQKVDTAMIVIDNLDQLDNALAFARAHRDLFHCFRLKIATNVWNEGNATPLFNSQIIAWFEERGPVIIDEHAKAIYTPFLFDGITFAAVSWYDVDNVDLSDMAMPPTYRARTGEVCDFVKALIINKGFDLGWLAGRRI